MSGARVVRVGFLPWGSIAKRGKKYLEDKVTAPIKKEAVAAGKKHAQQLILAGSSGLALGLLIAIAVKR